MSTAVMEVQEPLTSSELMEKFIDERCQADATDVRNQLGISVRINGCGPKLRRRQHIEIAVTESPGARVGEWQGEGVIGNASGACLWEQDVTEAGIRYARFLIEILDENGVIQW